MQYDMTQYRQEVEQFRWEIPTDYNIVDVVEGHAARHPDKIAVLWEDADGTERRVTYSELAEGTRRFGAALIGLGVRKRDPVIHILPRVPEAHMAQLGTFVAGGVAVPSSEMLKSSEIVYRSQVSGAKVIVADVSTAETVEAARGTCPLETFILIGTDESRDGWLLFSDLMAAADPSVAKVALTADDPMTINFTSGTTGSPKPVVHKHRWMYCHHRITARYWYGATEDDIIWATTAPGWAKWYWSPIGVSLTTGATQLMYNGRFDGLRYLELLAKYRVTKLCATPTEYRLFAQIRTSQAKASPCRTRCPPASR